MAGPQGKGREFLSSPGLFQAQEKFKEALRKSEENVGKAKVVELKKGWLDEPDTGGNINKLIVRKPRKLPSRAYSVQEIHKLFGVSEDKITRDIREGRLEAFVFGRVYRIGHEDLMEYFDRQARKKGVG